MYIVVIQTYETQIKIVKADIYVKSNRFVYRFKNKNLTYYVL